MGRQGLRRGEGDERGAAQPGHDWCQHSGRLCDELSGEQLRGGGDEGDSNLVLQAQCRRAFFVVLPSGVAATTDEWGRCDACPALQAHS